MGFGNGKSYNYFLSAAVTLVFLTVYSSFASQVFPAGLNSTFALNLWKGLMPAAAAVSIFCAAYFRLTGRKFKIKTGRPEKPEPEDFVPILLPLAFILQYVAMNRTELTAPETVLLILIFGAFCAFFCAAIPLLLSFLAPKFILISASTSFLFVVFYMPALAGARNWSGQGTFSIQFAVMASVFFSLLLLRIINKKILTITVFAFFIAHVAAVIAGEESSHTQDALAPPCRRDAPSFETPGPEKDVLLMVYEAYAPCETVLHYGFDNAVQLRFLEKNGFTVYHGVYTIGTPTIPAMSRVFDLDRDSHGREFIAGGGRVHETFRELGYKIYGVFPGDYFLRGVDKTDIQFDFYAMKPLGRVGLLIKAVFTGEFTDEISIEDRGYESYLTRKRKTIRGAFPSPYMMYSHGPLPGHRPSTSVNSDDADKYMEKYIENLRKTNYEMKKDIELILEYNEDAVVIISGDHGPFLTKSGYGVHRIPGEYGPEDIDRHDIQDRYGAFLAVRWPDKKYSCEHDIKILQDVFPAVFSYLSGNEELFNETRIKDRTTINSRVAGVKVKDGIIAGGKNDGEPLFLFRH